MNEKTSISDLVSRAEKIKLTELDVRKQKPRFISFLKNKFDKLLLESSRDTLTKYAEWHLNQLESGTMQFASAKRSLEVALDLANFCKDINELNKKDIEAWWDTQLTRNAVQTTGGETKKQTDRKLSPGGRQKLRSQATKLIKFIIFLKKDSPLSMFDTSHVLLPDELMFLSYGEKKSNKGKQKPKVSQQEISDLINCLRDGTTVGEATALMVSLANDVGARYSELASLQLKDLKTFPDYIEISFPQSKTIPRTVISALSKPLLMSWVSRIPNSNDKNTYLFSTKEGTVIAYENMRRKLQDALEEQNLEWKQQSSFHYLRHLFVARAIDWSTPLLNYWLGWSQQGMISVYGDFSVEKCKPHYFNMLRQEKNPMLDSKLSLLHKDEHNQEESMKEYVISAVEAYLKSKKG